MRVNRLGPTLLLLAAATGCVDQNALLLQQVRDLNETNVMKVRTCFEMFASRHDRRYPESQEELAAFLKSGKVDANLERLGVDPAAVDELFKSERDGEPLKVRYGIPFSPNKPQPIAFEATGVDGVRLVSADVLLEVDSDQLYRDLWNGKYNSELLKKRAASQP